MILQIALDTPLRRVFDYRPPAGFVGSGAHGAPPLGVRVRVPFGRRQLIGVLVGITGESVIESGKLKSAFDILDRQPIVDPVTFDLLRWAADYYHHPLGEVFAAALPISLREGQATQHSTEWWSVSDSGRQELLAPSDRRAPQQRALLAWLAQRGSASLDDLETFKPAHLRALASRGRVTPQGNATTGAVADPIGPHALPSEVGLTQQEVTRRVFSDPNTMLGTTFGQTTSSLPARELQMAAKIVF